MATAKSVAKTIRNIFNEAMDRSSWDDIPSLDKFPGCFIEVDKSNPESIIVSSENEKPLFKITVEKI